MELRGLAESHAQARAPARFTSAVTRGLRESAVIGLGVLATRSSVSNLDSVVTWGSLIGSTLVWATPLCYAAVGGMINERSGVVNIGLEGMMLAGAFFACLGADKFGSWEMGLLTAAVAGAGFALVHAFFAIHLRSSTCPQGPQYSRQDRSQFRRTYRASQPFRRR